MAQEHIVLSEETHLALPILQQYFSCVAIEPILGFAILVLDTMGREISAGWMVGSYDARTGRVRTLKLNGFSPDVESRDISSGVRYRMCMTDEAWATLERLKSQFSVQKIDTLFDLGVSVVRWAVDERKAGSAFGSHHVQSRCFKEVLFPPRLGDDDDSGRRPPPKPPVDPVSPDGLSLESETAKG